MPFKELADIFRYRKHLVLVLAIGIGALGLLIGCKPQKPEVLEADRPEIYKDTTEKMPELKPKPMKRGEYYGIRTRKAFTKVVKNRKRTYELFHVLKKPQEPNPYNLSNCYWFHKKKRKIMIGPIPEKEFQYSRLLHGPYKRTFAGKTTEEGIFYQGAKHGRWEQYTNTDDQILVNKEKWYKGFPKESEITYYDVEQTQIKEVVPVVNGERHGEYFYFNQKGQVIVYGKYEYNKRIGIWLEYWEGTKKKSIKKKTQYPESAFAEQFDGYLLQELDAKGTIIYDKAQEESKLKAKKAAEDKIKADKEAADRAAEMNRIMQEQLKKTGSK